MTADTKRAASPRRLRQGSLITQKTAPYFFMAPVVILFLAFFVYPVAHSLVLSFFELSGGSYTFVKLDNYITLAKDPIFWKSVGNTFWYLVVQVPVMIVLSLMFAVLIEQKFLRFRTAFRMGIFLPCITALVAYSLVFKMLLNTDYGLINLALQSLHLPTVDWLNTVWGARASIILAITWRWTGYNTIIMIAGIKAIGDELYESADMDGATFWQKFTRITVPMVKPIILFVSITSTIGTLQMFDQSFILTGGGPDNATISIGHYLYSNGFVYYNVGYAAAISYVLVLMIALLSWLQFRATQGGENK